MLTQQRATVSIERMDNGITWLIMNRPEKRNAMNPTMHFEMVDALDELEADDTTAIVILTGAGDDAFCAGQDLKEFFRNLQDKPHEWTKAFRASQDWRFNRLTNFPKLTIAMVNGWCCGGAFTQLINCDFAITADEAQFSLSEVNWGILPGGMVTKVIADAVRYREALYYILTAEAFDGKKAVELGLANKSVPFDKLRETTLALAESLLEKNQLTLRAAKEAYRAVRTMDAAQAEDYLAAKSAALIASDPERGMKQGIDKFVDDKRYRPALTPYPRD